MFKMTGSILLTSICITITTACSALSQGVASFETSQDAAALSIEPNELASGAMVPPALSDKVIEALKQMAETSGHDVDALSFFVAPRQITGASWSQYQMGEIEIGANSVIVAQSAADGQFQVFTKDTLPKDGFTAAFNGDTVYFYTGIHPSDQQFEQNVAAEGLNIDGATWGTPPGQGMELNGFSPLGGQAISESICGLDDRIASNHAFVGRIMPIGCTGWLASTGAVLTAGHCIVPGQVRELEFNVPSSNPVGLVQRSALDSQYKIDISSIVFSDPYSIGNDWAVFQVEPNSQTGKTVFEAQGKGFEISNSTPPNSLTIVGYGVDDTPMLANQTQQIHSNSLVGEFVRGSTDVVLKHRVDTRGGNSGSPILGLNSSGVETAFGIHTNAGCMASGGSNNATGFKNADLWRAAN